LIDDRQLTLVMVNLNYHEIEKIVQRVILIRDNHISVDETLDELKARVKRIDTAEKITDQKVIFSNQFGDRFEHIVYPYQPGWEGDRKVSIDDLNLHEIIKAFMGENYA
jgi:ABC-type multidrug transport system ATPase subunit